MKVLLVIILIGIFSASCTRDFESDLTKSPSGKYFVKATVDRTNNNANNYANVLIHIYNSDEKEIKVIDSKAGDSNKWALGWTTLGDTIVLQSSDIGNKAWEINDDNLSELTMTDKLNKRAEEIYNAKYKLKSK